MKSGKKRIGFDLDGVIFPFEDGLIEYYNTVHINSELGKKQKLKPVKLEDIYMYNLTVVFKQYDKHKDVNDHILVPYEASDLYKRLNPIEGAGSVLKKLKDRGYELAVITSRGDNLFGFTKSYLEKHFPGIFEEKDIWFNKHFQGRCLSKGDVCKEMDVGIMVDDSLHNCNGVVTTTDFQCASFLFGVTPWDNDDSKFKKNVFRTLTWDNLYEKILEMEKE